MSAVTLSATTSTALVACVAVVAFARFERAAVRKWLHECAGSFLVILLCCSPTAVFGNALGGWADWAAHCAGVVLVDLVGCGPHANPAFTTAALVWGQTALDTKSARHKPQTSALFLGWAVSLAGQLAGGLLGWAVLSALLDAWGEAGPLGGPALGGNTDYTDALLSEGHGTFLLVWAICCLVFTRVNDVYLLRQSLIGVAIRLIILLHPTTGPALNPMIATSYALFRHGTHAVDVAHLGVYWLAACAGAAAAAFFWEGALRLRAAPPRSAKTD